MLTGRKRRAPALESRRDGTSLTFKKREDDGGAQGALVRYDVKLEPTGASRYRRRSVGKGKGHSARTCPPRDLVAPFFSLTNSGELRGALHSLLSFPVHKVPRALPARSILKLARED